MAMQQINYFIGSNANCIDPYFNYTGNISDSSGTILGPLPSYIAVDGSNKIMVNVSDTAPVGTYYIVITGVAPEPYITSSILVEI